MAVALVVLSAIAAVLILRGAAKPYSPDAPAFRQKGPAEAPIVIVEFSDFQCPACRYAVAPLKGLLELYPGKIRLVFKHFPLERAHKWARYAARAAECAGRQGKFWELHDALYEKQDQWPEADTEKLIAGYAKAAGVDVKALEACVAEPAVDQAVSADQREGDRRWVGSTPTFFINGKRFVGSKQLGALGSLHIEKILKKGS